MRTKHVLSKILDLIEYLLLIPLILLIRILSWNSAIALSRKLAMLASKLIKKRYLISVDNIQKGLQVSRQEAEKMANQVWQNMGQLMAEFIKCAHYNKKQLSEHTELRGKEKIEKYLAGGKGALIHAGHFTNWEVMGLTMSANGIDKIAIAKRTSNKFVDKKIIAMREKFGGKIVYNRNPFFSCVRTLKQGRSVGILMDQSVSHGSVFSKFMGRMAATSSLTALLSLKLKIPIFPVKVTRENGKIISRFLDPIEPIGKYTQENMMKTIDILNGYYETWVKEDPTSWFWLHNRWKREHDAPKGDNNEKK